MAIDASVDLRGLVREVLREAIAAHGAAGQGAARSAPAGGSGVGPHLVSIGSDAELQVFIARLAAPGTIEAVRAGTARFTLAPAQTSAPPPPQATGAPAVMEGVISERRLQGIAAGTTITLAKTAVVTPMAKDVGRRLGLKFERMG